MSQYYDKTRIEQEPQNQQAQNEELHAAIQQLLQVYVNAVLTQEEREKNNKRK